MKLRVKGNSLRLRLTRPEVMRLRADGLVEESADFGAGATLVYRVKCVASSEPVHPAYCQGSTSEIIRSETAQEWTTPDEIGIYAQAGELRNSVEKDFRCLTRSDEEEERDAFSHPAETAVADDGGTTCRS